MFLGCSSISKKESHFIGEDSLGLKVLDSCLYDTTLYLNSLNIVEEVMFEITVDTSGYHNRIDTFELEYTGYACSCPRWVVADSLTQNLQFDYYDSYYLQPATKSLVLPEAIHFGTRIQFIGQVSKEMLYYDDWMSGKKSSDDDEPGYELKYYSFKILKPYYVLGPQVCRYDKYDDIIRLVRDKLIVN